MGFVEQSLSSEERIIIKARLHWGMFLGPLVGIMMGLGFTLVSLLPVLVPNALSPLEIETDAVIVGGLCCFGGSFLWLFLSLLGLASRFATYLTTEFAVTNKRVIAKSGALRRRSLEVMLTKIESVSVDEPLLGRVLNYGTLVIRGSGGTTQPFAFISNAMDLRMQINNLIPPTR